MSDNDYSMVIGRLIRLKAYLKPSYRSAVDEIVDSLVVEVEELNGN